MRLILAGCDSSNAFDTVVEQKAPYIRLSYWYLRQKSAKRLESIFSQYQGEILVDSGAYQWAEVHGISDLEKADKYVESYIKFILKYSKSIHAHGEFDLVGVEYDTICAWRTMFHSAGLCPILTVREEWPREDQIHTLQGSANYGCYVGLTSDKGRRDISAYKQWFSDYKTLLEEERIRVHGWAVTRQEALSKVSFYSLCSTSWIGGQRYGMTYIHRKGTLKLKSYDKTQKSEVRPTLLGQVQALGLDSNKFMEDDEATVSAWNCAQWVSLAHECESQHHMAYWLTPGERRKLVLRDQDTWGVQTAVVRHEEVSLPLPSGAKTALDIARYCNTCSLSSKCPQYKPDSTCTLTHAQEIPGAQGIEASIGTLLAIQLDRVVGLTAVERIQGAFGDDTLSKELDRYMKMLKTAKDVLAPVNKVAKIEVPLDGSGQGESILAMFAPTSKQTREKSITPVKGVASRNESSQMKKTFNAARKVAGEVKATPDIEDIKVKPDVVVTKSKK